MEPRKCYVANGLPPISFPDQPTKGFTINLPPNKTHTRLTDSYWCDRFHLLYCTSKANKLTNMAATHWFSSAQARTMIPLIATVTTYQTYTVFWLLTQTVQLTRRHRGVLPLARLNTSTSPGHHLASN